MFSQVLYTAVTLVGIVVVRYVLVGIVDRFGQRNEKMEHRTKRVAKVIDYAAFFLFFLCLFVIWGIDFNDLGLVFSSVFAVIGVAFFAQWSILSNVTSGIVLFFTFPFRIGDRIRLHDKEFVEGVLTIEDIRTFHIVLRTEDGQRITYPNSLLLQKGVTMVGN